MNTASNNRELFARKALNPIAGLSDVSGAAI
jgi:hypothetical protein